MSPRKNNPFFTLSYLLMFGMVILLIGVLKDELKVTPKIQPKSSTGMQHTNTETVWENGSSVQKKETLLIDDVPFTAQAPYANWSDIIYEE